MIQILFSLHIIGHWRCENVTRKYKRNSVNNWNWSVQIFNRIKYNLCVDAYEL